MAKPAFDTLRALAIASQAIGFILIITLGTLMEEGARYWQGVTLAVMVAFALVIAVARLYRRNKWRKRHDAARREHDD
ncbi:MULTISPECIES: hypothetical protein [Halomonadaceae]|uniref:hypothetical protein n=1 Tax=Halomonas TaxID=2745 RepID=UPI0018A71241|nr:hypothetical protein [Halomonas sp. 328]MBF8223543.1 hypothetical protein [Halomonas sp. 328]